MSVCLRVHHVSTQVANDSSSSILFDVIVEPPDENFLVAQLFENIIILALLLEDYNFWMQFKVDLIRQMDLD